jgi:hypothetical protein
MAAFDYADEIEAIKVYVDDQASRYAEFPRLKTLIPDFRRFYNDLTFFGKHYIKSNYDEARRRRDEINEAMKKAVPPWIPADKEGEAPITIGGNLLLFGAGAVALSLLIVFTRPRSQILILGSKK